MDFFKLFQIYQCTPLAKFVSHILILIQLHSLILFLCPIVTIFVWVSHSSLGHFSIVHFWCYWWMKNIVHKQFYSVLDIFRQWCSDLIWPTWLLHPRKLWREMNLLLKLSWVPLMSKATQGGDFYVSPNFASSRFYVFGNEIFWPFHVTIHSFFFHLKVRELKWTDSKVIL